MEKHEQRPICKLLAQDAWKFVVVNVSIVKYQFDKILICRVALNLFSLPEEYKTVLYTWVELERKEDLLSFDSCRIRGYAPSWLSSPTITFYGINDIWC